MRRVVAADWPSFDSAVLQEIVAAVQLRRKAISYHVGLVCEREFSESASGIAERLNLNAGDLRLSVWSDRVMWLAVCIRGFGRNAGWVFKDTFHGELHDISADELVGMLEATLAMPFGLDSADHRQRLREIWSRAHPYAD